jgi:predicted Zn-dependent protease
VASDSPAAVSSAAGLAPQRDLASIQERLRDGAPGTYILHMLAEQNQELHRWPDRALEPLRVWIQRDAQIADWSPTYPDVAERAFEEWQNAGFPIRFDRVLDSTTADIRIEFVPQMPPEDDQRIGIATKMRDTNGWIREARVKIAIHDRTGRPLPAATVAGTARHEIGHVLGLGHSNATTDVMFPESRTSVISAADRATLHLIYILPPGPVK